jgi:hypothetical protein
MPENLKSPSGFVKLYKTNKKIERKYKTMLQRRLKVCMQANIILIVVLKWTLLVLSGSRKGPCPVYQDDYSSVQCFGVKLKTMLLL